MEQIKSLYELCEEYVETCNVEEFLYKQGYKKESKLRKECRDRLNELELDIKEYFTIQ